MREQQRGGPSQNRTTSPSRSKSPLLSRPSSGLRCSFAPGKHVQVELPHHAAPPQRVQLRDILREPKRLGYTPGRTSFRVHSPSKLISRVSSTVKPVQRVPTFAPHLRVENHLIKANIAALWNPKTSRWSHPTPAQTVVSNNVANCLLASHKLLIKETARSGLLQSQKPNPPVGPRPKSPVRPKSSVEAGKVSGLQSPARPGSALALTPTRVKDILKSADVFAKVSAENAHSEWLCLSPLYRSNLLHFNELLDDYGEMHGTGEEFLEERNLLTRGRIRPKSSTTRRPAAGRERPSSAMEASSKHALRSGDYTSKRPMSACAGRPSRAWNDDAEGGTFGEELGAEGGLHLRDLSNEAPISESVSREHSDSDVSAASPNNRRDQLIEDDDWLASLPSQGRPPVNASVFASPISACARNSPLGSPKRVSLNGMLSPREQDTLESAHASPYASSGFRSNSSPMPPASISGFVSVRGDGTGLPQTTSQTSYTSEAAFPGGVETRSQSVEAADRKEQKKKSAESAMHKELKARKQHWRHVTEALKELSSAIQAGLVNNAQDMRSYVVRYTTEQAIQENSMIGLEKALTLAESPFTEQDFFSRILPTIVNRALAMTEFFPNGRLPNMKRGAESRMVISRAETASVLANMFLCSLPRNDFSLGAVHTSHQGYQIAKLHFFINYFDRISHLSTEEPLGNIEVYKALHDSKLDWLRCRRPLLPLTVNFGRAVDEQGTLQVMPSHSNIGGGMLYRGRGEEEVRLLLYPEVCIAMFVCGVIDDNEAVTVRGAERFSDVVGDDGFTLKFNGSFKDKSERGADSTLRSSILLVDASKFERITELSEQLEVANMDRDLNKILRGFSEVSEASEASEASETDTLSSLGPISSTNWGCDRQFNGARDVRPLIQWVAASVAGRELHLWLPEDKANTALRRQLEQLSELCIKNAVDVGQLLHGCHEVREAYRKEGTLIPMILKSLMLVPDSGSDDDGNSSPLFRSVRAPYVVTSGHMEQLVSPLVPLTRSRVFNANSPAVSESESDEGHEV